VRCTGSDCDHGVAYRCGENHETTEGCTAFYLETDMCCVGPEACEECHGLGQVLADGIDPRAGLRSKASKTGLTIALLRELDLEEHLADDLDLADAVELPLSMIWDREFSESHGETWYWPEAVLDARYRTVLDLVGSDSVSDVSLARLLAIMAAGNADGAAATAPAIEG
jgi:hypothetical protein